MMYSEKSSLSMFAIDTNLLVYAHNIAPEFHEHAAKVYQFRPYYKIPLCKRGKQLGCPELLRNCLYFMQLLKIYVQLMTNNGPPTLLKKRGSKP